MTPKPLPKEAACYMRGCNVPLEEGDLLFTAEQMRAYAEKHGAACAGAERERCIEIVTNYQVPVGNSRAGEMAADWTIDALREIRVAIRAMKEST